MTRASCISCSRCSSMGESFTGIGTDGPSDIGCSEESGCLSAEDGEVSPLAAAEAAACAVMPWEAIQ